MGTTTPPDWRLIVQRISILALAGGLTAVAVANELTNALQFLAGAGAGWAASKLFAWVRANARLQAWIASSGQRWLNLVKYAIAWLFFSSASAALTVAGLSAAIAGAATLALALISGQPLGEAWPAMVAFAMSQWVYFLNHPDPLPTSPHARQQADAASAAAALTLAERRAGDTLPGGVWKTEQPEREREIGH